MPADIRIELDPEFTRQLRQFAGMLRKWDADSEDRIEKAMRIIANRWLGECKKRVPVDNSTLRQRLLSEVYREGHTWVCACGTNVPYGKWLEFGTRFIAGGRVMALGEGIEITDSEAIRDWPAKNALPIGHKIDSAGRVRDSRGKFLKGGGSSAEQMPWLRPALNAIKPWAMQLLLEAILPPVA